MAVGKAVASLIGARARRLGRESVDWLGNVGPEGYLGHVIWVGNVF